MVEQFQFEPEEVAIDAIEAVEPDGRALHIEVGFGKDIRILREAEHDPDGLYVGIEISRKKAESFCRKVARAGLRNVRCYWGDVRSALERLPAGSVSSFTILFPDPWPKRRQSKHRWIQAPTAALLASALRGGGGVIVATDHDGYVEQIREVLGGAGLALEHESDEIPDEDRTLFARRFERVGETVTYQRWRKADSG